MSDTSDAERHTFAGARYSISRRCVILADGTEAGLRPKSLAVFFHLAEHADQAISKDDLIEAVWAGVFVTDGSLVQCIGDIRRALADTDHVVLRTISRHGYLLVSDSPASNLKDDIAGASVAEIVAPGAAVSPADVAPAAISHAGGPPVRRGQATVLGLLLVSGILIWWFGGISSPQAPATSMADAPAGPVVNQIPTVAVEIAPASSDMAVLTAVTGELRAALSRYKTVQLVDQGPADYRLVVRLLAASMSPMQRPDAADQAGKVELVANADQPHAAGSDEQSGMRLLAELIDTATDKVFLANSYPVPAGEDTAHRLAVRIAAFASPAGGALSRHLMAQARYKPVDSLTRAECYAHGYDCTTCSGELETINERAQVCLDRLLADNPNDATAWALKSTLHVNQYRYGYTLREPERSNLQARAHRAGMAVEAAQKAVQLGDGTDTAIYWGLAQAYGATCEIDKLRAAVDNGLKINPDDPALLAAFGNWLAYAGDWDRGAKLIRKAMAIEPRMTRRWWLYGLIDGHYMRDEYEHAHTLVRQAYAENDWVSHMDLAFILPYLGRIDEAREVGRRLLHLNPGFTIEKALQFKKVHCFSNEFLAKVKHALQLAGIPERGDSTDLDRILTPPVKVLPINGAPIEFLDLGHGEPVLFVHGAGGDFRTWRYYEEAISRKHRYISLSMRYFGSQPWPDTGVTATHQQLVDDLAEFIGAMNVGPVHLVTWSLGGTIGTVLAARRPELIKSALHFEPFIGNLIVGDPEYETAFADLFQRLAPSIERVQAGDAPNAARRLIEGVFLKDTGAFESEVIGVQRVYVQNGASLGPLIYRQDGVLQVPGVNCDLFKATTAPTLLVRGENTHPIYVMQVDQFSQCIPGARQLVIPGVTHDGPIRSVDAMTAMILDMVDRHASR